MSRLRSVDGRFGDASSNACREFDAMLAGDHADRVGLVLEPVYQEVEPKLGPDGFASSGDQVVWRFERVLRIARRNALFQAIACCFFGRACLSCFCTFSVQALADSSLTHSIGVPGLRGLRATVNVRSVALLLIHAATCRTSVKRKGRIRLGVFGALRSPATNSIR